MTRRRHTWADTPPDRHSGFTDRYCSRCGLVKRHRIGADGTHWTEYWDGEGRISGDKDMPECVPTDQQGEDYGTRSET